MANKLKAVKSKLTRQTFPQSINTCERSVIEIASKSPFTCVNRIPIWYDFRGGTKAIQYSVTIVSLICTTSPSLLELHLHIPQQLRSSKRQNLWPRTTTTKVKENVLIN